MRSILALTLCTAFLNITTAIADDTVDHYIPEVPTSISHAQGSFTHGLDEVSNIIKKDTLSASDLESIHEISYTLENAVAYMETHQPDAFKGKLLDVKNTVEELHIASEHHGEDKTRTAFTQLTNLTK